MQRSPGTKLALLASASVLLAACGSDGGARTSSAVPPPQGVLSTLAPGDPLADVELAVLSEQDAGTIDMGDLGGPAVVNFWATWCAFCVDEMPDFEAVHQQVGDRVRFVGVDREDTRERALTFAEELGVTYDLVEDPDGRFFSAAKGRGMPTTLFVDAEGIIRHRHAGPLSQQQLLELIEEHLGIESA